MNATNATESQFVKSMREFGSALASVFSIRAIQILLALLLMPVGYYATKTYSRDALLPNEFRIETRGSQVTLDGNHYTATLPLQLGNGTENSIHDVTMEYTIYACKHGYDNISECQKADNFEEIFPVKLMPGDFMDDIHERTGRVSDKILENGYEHLKIKSRMSSMTDSVLIEMQNKMEAEDNFNVNTAHTSITEEEYRKERRLSY